MIKNAARIYISTSKNANDAIIMIRPRTTYKIPTSRSCVSLDFWEKALNRIDNPFSNANIPRRMIMTFNVPPGYTSAIIPITTANIPNINLPFYHLKNPI